MSTKHNSIHDAIVDHIINLIEDATLGEQKAKKKGKEPEPHPRKAQLEAALSNGAFGCARNDALRLVEILTGVKFSNGKGAGKLLKGDCKVVIVTSQHVSQHRHPTGSPVVPLTKDGNCFGLDDKVPLRYDYATVEEVREATNEEAVAFIEAIKAKKERLSSWINQFSLKAFGI